MGGALFGFLDTLGEVERKVSRWPSRIKQFRLTWCPVPFRRAYRTAALEQIAIDWLEGQGIPYEKDEKPASDSTAPR